MSSKYGTSERVVGERFFADQTEASLEELIRSHQQLSIIRMWTSPDVRPGRSQEKWLNAVVRKFIPLPEKMEILDLRP